MPKNTTQCPGPGLEPRPLDQETNALTMRPPRLPHVFYFLKKLMHCRTKACVEGVSKNILRKLRSRGVGPFLGHPLPTSPHFFAHPRRSPLIDRLLARFSMTSPPGNRCYAGYRASDLLTIYWLCYNFSYFFFVLPHSNNGNGLTSERCPNSWHKLYPVSLILSDEVPNCFSCRKKKKKSYLDSLLKAFKAWSLPYSRYIEPLSTFATVLYPITAIVL